MAAPVVASVGTFVTPGSNVCAPGVPSGVASGSLVVAVVTGVYLANITTTTGTITVPSGWTCVNAASVWSPSDGITFSIWFCYKYATGADTGTYSFTANAIGGNSAVATDGSGMRITGGPASGNPFVDTFLSTGNASASSTIAHTSTTPGGNDSLLIAKIASDGPTGVTVPSGWSALSSGTGMLSTLSQSTAAATGTMTWTFNSSAAAALLSIGTIRPPASVVTGTGALHLPALTAAGSGTVINPVTGTGALHLPALTASGSGTVTVPAITGTGVLTLPALTAAGTGTVTTPGVTGTGALTLPSFIVDGTGTVTAPSTDVTGTGDLVLPGFTIAGSGTVINPITGTGALILPHLTMSGSGTTTFPTPPSGPTPPAFKLRLRLYTPAGVRGRVIPTMTLSVDQVYGDASTCKATVSSVAYQNLPAFPIVAAVEFSAGDSWAELSNGRFVFQGDDLDAVDPAGVRTLTGMQFVPWMLQRVLMQHPTSAKNGTRLWSPDGATPGQIIAGMMLEGHNRGWASYITTTTTTAADSAGATWLHTALKKSYQLGVPVWQVLTGLVADGVAEFVTLGNVLGVYNPGGHGHDFSTGDTIIRLSHDATTIPVKRSWASVLTDLTLAGDNNLLATVHNAGAPTTFGRLEGWVDSSGSTTTATLTSLGTKTLAQAAAPTREVQMTADAHDMPNLPWVSYGISDWVLFRAEQGWEKGRVVELVASQDQDGKIEITTIIGDRNQTLLSRLAQKTVASTNGASGSTKPVQVNSNPPEVPTGLDGTVTSGFDAAGTPNATVMLSWDAVTVDDTGEPVDVNQYQVWMRLDGQTQATSLATVDTNAFVRAGLPVGTTAYFTVRAMSSTAVWGAFTSELGLSLDAPTQRLDPPDAPTILEAPDGVIANWDGLLASAAPPAWFSHVYARTSATEGGTYVPAGGTLASAGDITIPVPSGSLWVVLIAVDRQGGESDPSTAVQVTAAPATPDGLVVAANDGQWDENGNPVGVITLTWDAVTEDILGNPITVTGYEVWLRHGDGTPSLLFQTVTDATFTVTLPVVALVEFMIRAISTTGSMSDFTDEVEVSPAVPTDTLDAPDDPIVETAHSILIVTWDGLLSTLTPPAQFWHVILEIAPDVDGDPGDFSQIGERSTAGDVTVGNVNMGDIVWVRWAAVDHLGVSGTPSNPVQVTVVGVDGDNIVAGSITVNHLSPTIGGDLDLSANDSITLTVGRIDDLDAALDDTNTALDAQQTTFQVQPDGAHIFSQGGSSEVVISDDEIDMQVNGQTVSSWTQQVFTVQSAVVGEIVIGNLHFQADGDGTLVRSV